MTAARSGDAVLLHASCVALQGRGLLVLGPSGAGKSALCLQLMAYGAILVADDQVIVQARDGLLLARCPPALTALIEARGIGLLNADALPEAQVVLVADLGRTETERLPPRRHATIAGVEVDLVLRSQNDHFPAAVLLYLARGRKA